MRFFPTVLMIASFTCVEPAAGAIRTSAASKVISPGTQVVDVAGNAVGTVQSVHGPELIIKTDRHEVRLPARSFTPDKGKLVFGMTRQALNQATDAMLAKALLPGSDVRGRNGGLVGQIEAINEQFVTVELETGQSIRLPRSSIAPGTDGAVLGITVAELQQMVNKAASPTP
jgi:preprotein translocase subunit YajC